VGLIPCKDCGWFHYARECLSIGDCVRVTSHADSSVVRLGVVVELFVENSDLQVKVSFADGSSETLDSYRHIEHANGLDVMLEQI